MPAVSSLLRPAVVLLVLCLLGVGSTATLGVAAKDDPRPRALVVTGKTRAAHERQLAAARARRADSEARAQRRRSRRVFGGKSDAKAKQILREQHGGVAGQQPWKRPSMGRGERIVGWRDDATAVIEGDDRPGKGLISSSLPLVDTDRHGVKRMLDYTLLDSGAFLVPDNPLLDVRLPKRLSDAIQVGDIGLRVETHGPSPEAQESDDKGFWPNIDVDTDLLVTPLPTGVETFHHLRSENSPEQISVHFDLPQGARMQKVTRQGPEGVGGSMEWFEIRRGHDRLATVLPPSAWDADNRDVPLTATLNGSTLELKVEHRGRDVRYPVIVDPYVDYHNWQAGQHWDKGTWFYHSSHGGTDELAARIPGYLTMGGSATYDDPEDAYGPYGNGLYLYTFQGGDYYDWEYANWRSNTRGNASIYRMDIGNVYYRPARDGLGNSISYIEQGICRWNCLDKYDYHQGDWFKATWEYHTEPTGASPSRDEWFPQYQWKTHCAAVHPLPQCDWAGGDAGNFAVFRLVLRPSGEHVKNAVGKFGIGHVAQWDEVDPVWREPKATHNFNPNAWITGDRVRTRLYAGDDGLGIEAIQLHHKAWDGSSQTQAHHTGCNRDTQNDRYVNCPQNRDHEFEYTVPKGISDASGNIIDYASRTSQGNPTWKVRRDPDGPTITLSGALWDNRDKPVTGSAPLTVAAVDGVAGSQATTRSGVKRVELWVDNRRIEDEVPGRQSTARGESTCDNCSITDTFAFDAADYDDDAHAVSVKAWDYAGNASSTDFNVVTDTRSPTVVASRHTNRPAGWIDSLVPTVDLRAEDAGGGVFSLNLQEVDGWKSALSTYGCSDTPAGRCATSPTQTIAYNQSTARLSEGINSVNGRARDPFDNGRDPFDNANPPVPPREGRGLRASYWTTSGLTPLVRNASQVDHNWGGAGPHPSVGGDFSAHFSGKVIPKYTETYTFYGLADDKAKLTVNGQVLFDDPTWDGVAETGQIALQGGQPYDIVFETQDIGDVAEAHLWWSSPRQSKEIIPGDRLLPPTAGLVGEFFDNKDLTGLSYRRYGSVPNSNWGTAAPEARIGAETWSARFLGRVTPRYTGTYTFFTRSDDGTRLWVDGTQLIDNFVTTNAVVERSGQIALEAGKAYDIRLEYFDDTGNASVALDWQSPQQAREVVPIDRLSAPAGKTAPWTVKVDRSPPEVPVSGPLAEIEGEYVEGPTPLDFNATDGATTSARTQRSGVKRWEIDTGTGTIPGGERPTVADSQPWSGTATVAPLDAAYRDGRNDVAIAAMDQLHPETNHRGVSRRIAVWMDKTPPTLSLTGGLKDAEGTGLWDGSYDLTARANDGSHDDPRSGVRRVEVFLGKQNADGSVSEETSVHNSEPRPGASANLVANSSFERMWGQRGTPGLWAWQGTFQRVTDAVAVQHGNHAGRLTATTTGTALAIVDGSRMSVTPGEKLTFSVYMRTAASGVKGHFAPRWFDASGRMINEGGGLPSTSITSRRSRYSGTWTVPAGVASIGWRVGMTNHAVGDQVDFDALQIERGETATDYAPRVTLNLFSNTSFEKEPGADGAPPLGRYAATWARVQAAAAVEDGSYAIRLTPTSTSGAQLINDAERVPVTPGEKLNFNAFLRASAAGSTAAMHARFFDASGAFVGQGGTPSRAVATTRSKYTGSWTVPANVAQIGWAITFSGHNGTTTLDIDAVQVERGLDDSEYKERTTANLFSNTSFERPSGQDGAPVLRPYVPGGTWSRIQDPASIHHGLWAARLSASTTTDHQLINDSELVPVRWGERITFSGYGRSSAAQGQWSVSSRWLNDAGEFLGQHDTGWRPMTTTRQRFTGSAVAPPGATRVGWIVTMTGHAPGQTLDVDAIQAERADTASRYRHNKLTDYHHSTGWTFTPSQHEPGEYRVRVRATDHLGQATDSSFTTEVDSPPELEVEGGLRSSPLATGRSLRATATDTYNGIRDIEVFAKSVPSTQLTPDGISPSTSGEPRLHHSPCPTTADCNSASGWVTDYELPSDFESGRYQFTVRTTDHGGQQTKEQWVVEVVQVRSTANHKLGLEQWFELDDTDAGGDSNVYVNGDTGNLVWHQTPIVNPGRGLSTVVNLTYNSHARGGTLGADVTRLPVIGLTPDEDGAFGTEQLHGLAYSQAGVGFSIAVGGPTRVNEPLGGALQAGIVERGQSAPDAAWPGTAEQLSLLEAANAHPGDALQTRITLTDADGTQHTFTRNPGDTAWNAPPGVDMRLRYVGERAQTPFGLLTVADLQEDEAWELLRPDGVAFRFDSFGFQRRSFDRNGNQLTYVYEWYSSITGQECTSNDPVLSLVSQAQFQNGLCIPRLQEVRQATWADTDAARHLKVALEYHEPTGTTVDLLSAFGLPANTLLGATYITGGGPKIDKLTDAAGVVYDLTYDSSGPYKGHLLQFTENATSREETPPRITRFRYCEGHPCGTPDGPAAGDVHQLTEIVPVDPDPTKPELPGTTIEYEPRDESDPIRPPAPRRAVALTKRSGERKLFRYTAEGDLESARFTVHEHTTGTRWLTRETTLDTKRRPHLVVERATDLANERDQVGDVAEREGSTTTRVVWNDDENKPSTLVEAVGDQSLERTTTYEYLPGGSGALRKRTMTDPNESYVTELDYYDGREGGFIADLERLILPGGRTWHYGVDPQGNVRQTTTPALVTVITDYGPGGVVTREQDEVEQWTVYADHDLGGQPQTVTRPSDPGRDRVWRYRYDVRGDVVAVMDPRATGTGYDDPYVTSLKYDAFGRLVEEHVARDSRDRNLPAEQRFALRTYDYNRDGAMTRRNERRLDHDLRGTPQAMKSTTTVYDAAGRPTTVIRPGGTAAQSRNEVTRYVFDGADRLIAEAAPLATGWSDHIEKAGTIRGEQLVACEGAGDAGQHDHVTRHCLDHAGRAIASVDYAPGHMLPSRVNAFAHDALGRLVGHNDPNRNAYYENGVQKPLSIAAAVDKVRVAATQRLSAEYDALDRAVRELERPDDGGPVREQRMHYTPVGDLDETRVVGSGRPDRVTRMRYDDMGRMTSTTDPLGRMTCWKRRPDGLVVSMTTPRGTEGQEALCETPTHLYAFHTTNYGYDSAGDVTFRSIPRAENQDLPAGAIDWHVAYERDVVGNPTKIADARGASFVNDFYDGGELRSTQRPSWWNVDWAGSADNPDPGHEFTGTDAADLEVVVDGPQIVERQGRSANAARSGHTPEKPHTLGKGDFGEPDQQMLPAWLPGMGATTFRYDEGMRLTHILDAEDRERRIAYDDAGRVTEKSWPLSPGLRIRHRYEYDLDGNLTKSLEDWNPNQPVETTFGYDGYDRRTFEQTPGAHATDVDAAPETERTEFSYDAADRLVRRQTPRGGSFAYGYTSLDELAFETNPADETWRYEYDVFGERRKEISPHAVGANAEHYTEHLSYDDAGQLIRSQRTAAAAGAAPQAIEVTFGYDRDGHREMVEEPGAPDRMTTRTEHDGRGLPWRVTVSGGSGDGARKRVSITEHDANGNLRRIVNPEGIGDDDLPISEDDGTNSSENLAAASDHATVLVSNADDLMTSERLPWHGESDKRYSREWMRDPQHGWVTETTLPHEVGSSEIWRMLYGRNHAGWVTTATDQTRERGPAEAADDTFTFTYDDRGNQTSWKTEHANQTADGREMRWTYWPNGLMKRRTAVKTLRSDGSDHPTTWRTYDYLYNKNRSLVRVVDRDARRDRDALEGNDGPEDPIRRTTEFARDLAERETRVDEWWAGGKDVWLSYDSGNTGLLTERRTDGELGSNGGTYTGPRAKTTAFEYDSLGRELKMTVDGPSGTRSATTSWHAGGQMRERNKARGATDRWSWDALGQKIRHERIVTGQTSDSSPTAYEYDDNGNRTADERGRHEFNARGHLVKWTRRTGRDDDKDGWITDYTVDGSGQVRTKVDRDGETKKLEVTNDIDGTRIDWTKVISHQPAGAVTTIDTYRYDDAGNIQRVYREIESPVPVQRDPVPKTALTPDECEDDVTTDEADGRDAVVRYCYDEFNRQVFSAGEGIEPRYITYDGLDRRDMSVKKDALGSPTERRDYAYIGTSELLSTRSTRDASTDTTTKRLTFDYDSRGDRQGIQIDDGEEGDTDDRYHAYAKDANGSVLGLENADGTLRTGAKYEYDPYGELDNPRDEAASGDEDAKFGITGDGAENPFRFEGFYYDSGVKTYDMHARHYRPEMGRFLSRDQYAAASGEEALQADPLTQNRYAFAGGNPVTNVEFDGHKACTDACKGHEHQQVVGGRAMKVNPNAGPGPTPMTRAEAQRSVRRAVRQVAVAHERAVAIRVATELVERGACFRRVCDDAMREGLIEEAYYRIVEGRSLSNLEAWGAPRNGQAEPVADLENALLIATGVGGAARSGGAFFRGLLSGSARERIKAGGHALALWLRNHPVQTIKLRRAYNRDVRAIYANVKKEFGITGAIPNDARGMQAAYVAWARRRALGIYYKNATPGPMREIIFGRNVRRAGYDDLGLTWNANVSKYNAVPDDMARAAARPNGYLRLLGSSGPRGGYQIRGLLNP